MWGSDYPHLEGAAPIHRLVLRHVFGGLPEDRGPADARAQRPRRLRLRPELLQTVADRVGPTVDDLASTVDLDELPKTFSWSLARPVPLSSPAGTSS